MKRLISVTSFTVTLALAAVTLLWAADRDAAVKKLADTEREFAAYSVEHGMPRAFYKYFADEGVNFNPHPSNTREFLKDEQDKPKPNFELDWYPAFNDVSAAGDLGYSTGPVKVSVLGEEKRPPRYSYYLSIWKMQPDGDWRVIVDHGIRTPDREGDWRSEPWRAAKPAGYRGGQTVAPEAIRQLEARFSAEVEAGGMASVYPKWVDDYVRIHHNLHFPADQRPAIEKLWAEADARGKYSWKPMEAGVSKSGDIAWSYSRFSVRADGNPNPLYEGYNIHIWKRNAAGDWKLALEVIRPDEVLLRREPPPAEQKEEKQ